MARHPNVGGAIIKISTDSATYERMIDDIDLNAGRVLEGMNVKQSCISASVVLSVVFLSTLPAQTCRCYRESTADKEIHDNGGEQAVYCCDEKAT